VELKQLRYFVAAAESGSFRKAAKLLNTSQPPLSLQIQHLEHAMGLKLFSRSRRGLELTIAGATLLEKARATLSNLDAVLTDVHERSKGIGGSVSVAYSDDFAYSKLPNLVGRYQVAYPNLSVSMTMSNSIEIVKAVGAGTVDLGFVTAPLPPSAFKLLTVQLSPAPLNYVVPANHPAALQAGSDFSLAGNEAFIAPSRDLCFGFYLHVSNIIRKLPTLPRIHEGIWPSQLMLEWVADGVGIAIVSRDSVRVDSQPIAMVPVLGADMEIRRCVILQPNPRPIVQRLLDHIVDRFDLGPE